MTEKELRRLRREDFLQLLLMQGEEMQELRTALDAANGELEQLRQSNERLKTRLDEKDALLERLKSRLDTKDATIRKLVSDMRKRQADRSIELEEAGSIAMAALKLNGVFEAAQKAADQYLETIRQRAEAGGAQTKPVNTAPENAALAAAERSADEALAQMLKEDRERDLQNPERPPQAQAAAEDPA